MMNETMKARIQDSKGKAATSFIKTAFLKTVHAFFREF